MRCGLLSPLADSDSLWPYSLHSSSLCQKMSARAPGLLLIGVLWGLGVSGDSIGREGREELRLLGHAERFVDRPGDLRWSATFILHIFSYRMIKLATD